MVLPRAERNPIGLQHQWRGSEREVVVRGQMQEPLVGPRPPARHTQLTHVSRHDMTCMDCVSEHAVVEQLLDGMEYQVERQWDAMREEGGK